MMVRSIPRFPLLWAGILLVMGSLIAGCSAFQTREQWEGGREPGWIQYRYQRYDGVDTARMAAGPGTEIVLDYDVNVEAGTLALAVTAPDGTSLWNARLQDAAGDRMVLPATAQGEYQIQIQGEETRGGFTVAWDVRPAGSGPALDPATPTRARQWQSNLDYLVRRLPERHINPFFQISREEFEQRAATLRNEIPNLTDAEIYVRMLQLVAALGDEHTTLAWRGSGLYYPINFQAFVEGIYVVAVTPEYADSLGTRLVAIGDTDAATVMARLGTVIPHANPQWVKVQAMNRMDSPDLLAGLGIISAPGTQPFTFERENGEQLTLVLEPIDPSRGLPEFRSAPPTEAMPLAYQSHDPGYYWARYLEESATLYLQYNVCANADGYPFRQLVDEVFAQIEGQPVAHFVVDLRHNSGGNSAVMKPLLAALARHPQLATEGRLFAIIGRHTFSSGLMNAIELRDQAGAVLVGETTGGKPNHYGEVRSFGLPHFGMRIHHSTKYWKQVAGDPPSLEPDRTVELTAVDYFAGRDSFLEAIVAGQP